MTPASVVERVLLVVAAIIAGGLAIREISVVVAAFRERARRHDRP